MAEQAKKSQKGNIRLHHVLLIVIAVVGLVLLFKKGMIPGLDKFNMPTMADIKEKLPDVSFKAPASNTTTFQQQSVNASVASAEGELINDEWTPPSEDNEVYQDAPDTSSTSLMTQDSDTSESDSTPSRSSTRTETNTSEVIQRPRRSTHAAPVRVKNPPKEFPANLERGYYTVQVYAGYNSKIAYGIRRSLEQDGYLVYIYQIEDKAGMLFRVRVGRYANLNSARAVRDQVRRRYPKQLSRSFVMMRQPSY